MTHDYAASLNKSTLHSAMFSVKTCSDYHYYSDVSHTYLVSHEHSIIIVDWVN